jgi:uncharacterized membrane protein
MGLFGSKKKQFFNEEQQQKLLATLKEAEKNTSGEIRLFVESKCTYVNPVDRAGEIFFSLKMDKTKDRNAVLIYIAMDDHQLAIFGDEGIYQRLGADYWNIEVRKMISAFKKDDHTAGICAIITDIGDALKEQFPYELSDKNELPDDIIFGH